MRFFGDKLLNFKFLLLFFCFSTTGSLSVFSQGIDPIDSLTKALEKEQVDSLKVEILNDLANEYLFVDSAKHKTYLTQALSLAEKIDYKKGIADSYLEYEWYYSSKGNYQMSIRYLQKAMDIYKAIGYKRGIATCLNNLGNAHDVLGKYSEALSYYLESLKSYESLSDSLGIADSYNNIGMVYSSLKEYEKSLGYLKLALRISEKLGDQDALRANINNLGIVYNYKGESDTALIYFDKVLKISQDMEYQPGIAMAFVNMGSVFERRKDYTKALDFYQKAMEIDVELQDSASIAEDLMAIGNIYRLQKRVEDAKQYFLQSYQISARLGISDNILEVFAGLRDLYEEIGDFRKAYEYQNKYLGLKDSVFNIEKSRSISEMQELYNSDKLQAANDLLTKENQIADERDKARILMIISGIVLLLGVLVVLGFVIRNNIQKQKTNQLLTKQKQEIEEKNTALKESHDNLLLLNQEINQQKEEIQTQRDDISNKNSLLEDALREIQRKNTDITSSINYAKRIQQAMLPFNEDIRRCLPDCFVYFRPKDIVSGDFYWFQEKGERIFIAAVDCTGHGVPGAFMSMIGNSILRQLVVEDGLTDPSEILSGMHKGVRASLKQDETANKDGMVASICVIEKDKKVMQYAGAVQPILLIENGQLTQIRGSKNSIGGFEINRNHPFVTHTFNYASAKSFSFYIFTDGYVDQFGGDEDRKFMIRRMRDFVSQIQHMPMDQQHALFARTMEKWMNGQKQIDDMLVIGVRLA